MDIKLGIMIMVFDVKTASLIASIITIFLTGSLGIMWGSQRTFKGIGWWFFAGICSISFFMLSGLRFDINPIYSVYIANVMSILAHFSLMKGIITFIDQYDEVSMKKYFIVLLLSFICILYFSFIDDDTFSRVFIDNFIGIFFDVSSLYYLYTGSVRGLNRSYVITGLGFFGNIISQLTVCILIITGMLDLILFGNSLQVINIMIELLFTLCWVISFILMINQRLQRDIDHLATFDPLTGIINRRVFVEFMEKEIFRSQREGSVFSMLLMDIDKFKSINDTYGHYIGDHVLKIFAETVTDCLRRNDIFGRYGGEEFCLLLPKTDDEIAMKIAERIRKTVENKIIEVDDMELSITISIGLCTFDGTKSNVDTIIKKADTALYISKESGRNKVTKA